MIIVFSILSSLICVELPIKDVIHPVRFKILSVNYIRLRPLLLAANSSRCRASIPAFLLVRLMAIGNFFFFFFYAMKAVVSD